MSKGKSSKAAGEIEAIRRTLGILPDDKCLFCHSSEINEDKYGKYIRTTEVTLHYFCMLFASGLSQRGQSDEHGIYGFMVEDIIKELKRGSRLRCTFCKSKGATIGCVVGKCRHVFHYSCGRDHNAMHQFFDTFNSFCSEHRPQQTVLTSDRLTFTGTATSTCSVCMCPVEARASFDTLRVPCCRGSWFHRSCIERHALTAGLYFFKCPLCNNKEQFQNEMLKYGVYIPDQDAAWEREPNAFGDLLERYLHCDAYKCRCHNGREYNKDGGKWEILVCDWCGSKGSHVFCHSLLKIKDDYVCLDCKKITEKTTKQDGKAKKLKCDRVLPSPRAESRMVDFNLENKAKSDYQQHPEPQRKLSLPEVELLSPEQESHDAPNNVKSPLLMTSPASVSHKASRFYYYTNKDTDDEEEFSLPSGMSNRQIRRIKRKRKEQVQLRKSLRLDIDMVWNEVNSDSEEEDRPRKLRRKSSILESDSETRRSYRRKKGARSSTATCTVSSASAQEDELSNKSIVHVSDMNREAPPLSSATSVSSIVAQGSLSPGLVTENIPKLIAEKNLKLIAENNLKLGTEDIPKLIVENNTRLITEKHPALTDMPICGSEKEVDSDSCSQEEFRDESDTIPHRPKPKYKRKKSKHDPNYVKRRRRIKHKKSVKEIFCGSEISDMDTSFVKSNAGYQLTVKETDSWDHEDGPGLASNSTVSQSTKGTRTSEDPGEDIEHDMESEVEITVIVCDLGVETESSVPEKTGRKITKDAENISKKHKTMSKSHSKHQRADVVTLNSKQHEDSENYSLDSSALSNSDSDSEIPLIELSKKKHGRSFKPETSTNLQMVSYENYLKELAGDVPVNTEEKSRQEMAGKAKDNRIIQEREVNREKVKGEDGKNKEKSKQKKNKKKKKKNDFDRRQMSIKNWLKINANKSSAEESSATEDERMEQPETAGDSDTTNKAAEEERSLKIRWKGRTFYFKRTIQAGSAFKENINGRVFLGTEKSRPSRKSPRRSVRERDLTHEEKTEYVVEESQSPRLKQIKNSLCESDLKSDTPDGNIRQLTRLAFTEKKRNVLRDRNITSPHTLPKQQKKSKFIEALLRFPDETINSCTKLSKATRRSLAKKFMDSPGKVCVLNGNNRSSPGTRNRGLSNMETLDQESEKSEVDNLDVDIVVLKDISRENPEVSPVADTYQCMLVDLAAENPQEDKGSVLSPVELSFDELSFTESESEHVVVGNAPQLVSLT